MIHGKTALAIIPARGGSKGLPGKNIKVLCGKPLIVWSIEAAAHSRYLDEVLVSTDLQTIADLAQQHGAKSPFLRPVELATDTAPTFEAVKHAIKFYRNNFNKEFTYIVLLEPTSPLREPDDIDSMLEKIDAESDRFDAIVSIGEVATHPAILKKIVNHALQPFYEGLPQTMRRQDNVPAYFPYGVAYIAKTEVLLEEKTFYSKRTTYYKIKRYQNYEIDDIYDFIAIEAIMKYQWNRI